MKTKKTRIYLRLVKGTVAGLAALAISFTACTSSVLEQGNGEAETKIVEEATMVYVGTYAAAENESIFLYRLNSETGELKRVSAAKGGENPSFLAVDSNNRYLYAVNEITEYEGKKSGAVSAFAIDQQTGELTLLNRQSSLGGAPCHISLTNDNKTILVANYVGGNVASFRVEEDGSLSTPVSSQQHEGSGANKERQEGPHAHFIQTGPKDRFAFAVDLGTDKIISYRLDAANGTLTSNQSSVAFSAKPGAGPRQMAFHPNGKFAFVINELNSTMTALAYSDNGTFTEIQTISTKPADFEGNNQCAAVKVSADGKFLYGSNRGHNSLVVYAIDANTGNLSLVEYVSTGGDWPRDFTLDLTGNILLVANERSNNIVTLKRDGSTGKLIPTGYQVEVNKPVCLQVTK